MNLIELEKYLREHEIFTIAEIQYKFSYGYATVRQVFRELEQSGKICLENGVTFKWMTNPQPKQIECEAPVVNNDEYENDDEAPRDDIIRKRRQELLELLAKMSEEDDDEEDEDDDFDIDDIFDEDENEDTDENTPCAVSFVNRIENFDYGKSLELANKLILKMSVFFINARLYSIQIGIKATRYVFDILLMRTRNDDLNKYENVIRSCIGTDEAVNIIAPYGNGSQLAVEVEHDAELDPYCKKALLYWLKNQNGRASIASIQRAFCIGYNRSGRIMNQLQQLNCVDCLSPSDSSAKPLFVKLSQENVEVLFPKSLGWEE